MVKSYDIALLQKFVSERSVKIKELTRIDAKGDFYSLAFFILFLPLLCIPLIICYIIFAKLIGRPGFIDELGFGANTSASVIILNLLIVFLAIKMIWRKFRPKMENKLNSLTKKCHELFHPFERTALICLELSKTLKSYSNPKVQLTTGDAEISDTRRNYRIMLVGKSGRKYDDRPYYRTNSFFVGIKNQNDICDKLIALNVPKVNYMEKMCNALHDVYVFILPGGGFFSGDYTLGALIFGKLSEAFVYAFKREYHKFYELLIQIVDLIKKYKTTKAQLVGLPLLFRLFVNFVISKYKVFLLRLVIISFSVVVAGYFLVIFPSVVIKHFPSLIGRGINEGIIRLLITFAFSVYTFISGKIIFRNK